MNNTQCSCHVFSSSDFSPHRCRNKVSVIVDDKPYCRIHDPTYLKEKAAKQEAKWDKEWKEKRESWVMDEARQKATLGLTLKELQRVTPEMIRKMLGTYPPTTWRQR